VLAFRTSLFAIRSSPEKPLAASSKPEGTGYVKAETLKEKLKSEERKAPSGLPVENLSTVLQASNCHGGARKLFCEP
jgi:hypothetical protein